MEREARRDLEGRMVTAMTQGAPILNHVAMTMPPAKLSPEVRSQIEKFYGDVFGWFKYESDEPGDPLVLATGAFAQFVYLLPGEPAMDTPALDHFGLQVGTLEELDGILERARDFQQHDDRVRIIDKKVGPTQETPIGNVTLTNCYIGYLLPLMVELQHLLIEPNESNA
jgi:hypothetical protein